MKQLNFDKLMALKPTEYDSIINAEGQVVTFVEHPIQGDEHPVIAVFKDLKMAFTTDFWDIDDMMSEHGEYTPVYLHGECKSQWEYDLSGVTYPVPDNTEEIRVIQCECGNWEEFPADMPRDKSQTFEWVENIEDDQNQAVYRCSCGALVVSIINETEIPE